MPSKTSIGTATPNDYPEIYGKAEKPWSISCPPLKNETISSWLTRCAMIYGIYPFSLVNNLAGQRINYWNFDVDTIHHPWWFIRKLAIKTRTPISKTYNTQLRRFKGLLYCRSSQGLGFWCCPISRYGDQKSKFGHQICTKCLTEDLTPYYRQYWRLAIQTKCHIHNVPLIDACPNCKHPIHLFSVTHKGNNNAKFGFEQCIVCGFLWKQHRTSNCSPDYVVSFEKTLFDCLTRGSTTAPDGNWKHSLSLMTGIAQLMRVLTNKTDKYRIREDTLSLIGLDTSFNVNWLPRYGFNGLTVEFRAKISHALAWLMTDWPHNLMKVVEVRNLTSNAFLDCKFFLPYWYENTIRQTIYHGWYQYSEEEIYSARNYMLAHYGFANDFLVNKLLGRLK